MEVMHPDQNLAALGRVAAMIVPITNALLELRTIPADKDEYGEAAKKVTGMFDGPSLTQQKLAAIATALWRLGGPSAFEKYGFPWVPEAVEFLEGQSNVIQVEAEK